MAASCRNIRSRSNGSGWGAWEIAGRVSMMDLNDQLGIANGVAGGRQTCLHRRAELVRQSQRPLHARLSAWRCRQAAQRRPTSPTQDRSSMRSRCGRRWRSRASDRNQAVASGFDGSLCANPSSLRARPPATGACRGCSRGPATRPDCYGIRAGAQHMPGIRRRS